MLGKEIRSYSQFSKNVRLEEITKFIYLNKNNVLFAEAMKATMNDYDGEPFNPIFFFNNVWGETFRQDINLDGTCKELYLARMNGRDFGKCGWFSNVRKRREKGRETFDCDMYRMINGQLILVDKDVEDAYEKFLKQNRKECDRLAEKYLPMDEPSSLFFFMVCEGSINLFRWMITNHCKYNVRWQLLVRIVGWTLRYKELLSKLQKGTPTAYNGIDDIFALQDELVRLKRLKTANSVISTFNPAQKKLLKDLSLSDRQLKAFACFEKLSETKRTNFIRKMSNVEDADEIMRQMELLSTVCFDWNKESLFEYINANEDVIKVETVYERDKLIVFKVLNFDTMRRLGKATSWCISKNRRYWDDYVESSYYKSGTIAQYMIFNFAEKEDSELSMIGFTTRTNVGIEHAHTFTNMAMVRDGFTNENVRSFIKRGDEIISTMNNLGIPVEMFYEVGEYLYKWDKDSFLTFLEKYFDDEIYDILYNEGDRLCLYINTPYIRFIIGNAYSKTRFDSDDTDEFYLFFDFGKSLYDSTHLYFVGVNLRGWDNSCRPGHVRNAFGHCVCESFESLLDAYGLPYNTLKRADSVYNRFVSAIDSYEMDKVDKMLDDKNLLKVLKARKNEDYERRMYNDLNDSILSLKTFDFVDVFKKHRINFLDVMQKGDMDAIFSELIYSIVSTYKDVKSVPTEEDFKNLYTANFTYDKAKLIGFYYIFMELCDMTVVKEGSETFKDSISSFIHSDPNPCFDEMTYHFAPLLDYSKCLNERTRNFLSFICLNKYEKAVEKVLSLCPCKYVVKHIKDNLPTGSVYVELCAKMLDAIQQEKNEGKNAFN